MASTIKTPGMIGQVGKVPGKEWFVDGHILDGHDPLLALDLNHAVDQQKGKSVRQNVENIDDVQRGLYRRRGCGRWVSGVGHFLSSGSYRCSLGAKIILYRDSTSAEREKLGKRGKKESMKKLRRGPRRKPGKHQTPNAAAAPTETANRLRFFTERKDAITETIRQLVEIESPSDNKPAVDQLGALLAGRFEKIGGHAKFHRAQDFGDHLQVDFAAERSGKPVLLLGHIDTVYPMGTLSTMPCRVADGRLWGPGALDMKSGIALILHAIEGLRTWHNDSLPRPVTVLLVTDEEVGSDSSRRITESLARKSAAVLVLEPAYGMKGAVKTARKGVGEYTITSDREGRALRSGFRQRRERDSLKWQNKSQPSPNWST